MKTFTALVSTVRRDTETGSPKMLLRDIECEGTPYRDHAHVEENDELVRLRQSIKGNKWVTITFLAKEKEYKYRGEVFKKTLHKVKDISIVRRKKQA
jgi:hypothetical protein